MSLFNEDELNAPSWINQEFFLMVLCQYENTENVKIIKLKISPASMKGDHYASIIFRCEVEYKTDNSPSSKQRSFVIKTLPDEGKKAETFQEMKAFETEISMYTKTLPKIEKILAECGEPTKLCAEIIYHSLQPHKVLIFEDLCASGYVALRTRLLTEEELQMVFRKLAKLHAVSFMLGQSEDHESVTKYNDGIFSHSAALTFDFLTGGIKNFRDMLFKHEEFKTYWEKVKIMEPEMFEKCMLLFNAYKMHSDPKDIFVLNHGDLHTKNMMFKFNSKNQLEDLIMVDYQISVYAPMSVDSIYFHYMMMRPEYRLRKNEFMYRHFSEFISVLKKLNYQGELPRYSDFQIANLKYRHFSLFLLSTFLPLQHVVQAVKSEEDLKDINVTELIENTNDLAPALYSHPSYLKELKQLLPSLLIDGYLD